MAVTEAEAALPEIYTEAEIYDVVYRGRGKDYAGEAAELDEVIRARRPGATTVLDMACGSGPHLAHLAPRYEHVEGVDLAEPMLERARAALPGVPFHAGDMREVRLGRRFDAVVCMFSSIGYLEGYDDLARAIATFAEHVHPGGVVAVEPWYFPETALDHAVTSDLVKEDPLTVSRISYVTIEGGGAPRHRMEAHYTVAQAGHGIRHFVDTHLLSLYTREEYERAFREAGCTVELLPDAARAGLFVGVREG